MTNINRLSLKHRKKRRPYKLHQPLLTAEDKTSMERETLARVKSLGIELAEVRQIVVNKWRWAMICAILTVICIYQALELRNYSTKFDSKLNLYKADNLRLEQELAFRKQVDLETAQQFRILTNKQDTLVKTFLKIFPVHGARMLKDSEL